MKCLRSLTAILPFAFAVCTAQAGLQIPYTPDADTLHLWHFNGPGGSVYQQRTKCKPPASH